MARFLRLTKLVFNAPDAEPERTLVNIDHVVAITPQAVNQFYPNGGSIITTTAIAEGGISEAHWVRETVEFISRELPI